MENFPDKLALNIFDLIALQKGFKFIKAQTDKEYKDAEDLYNEQAFNFPAHLQEDVKKYKAGTLNFVAYHKDVPVGMVRLANPKIINRAYEHYGVDANGVHHEIQSLVVKKEYRDGTQFVMLGLVKELYAYSIANSIRTWSGCGVNSVYLTMRRYCKHIQVIDVDFKNIPHPVTQYLYANNIVETYFIMQVDGFLPSQILRKFIKKSIKKPDVATLIKNKLSAVFSR